MSPTSLALHKIHFLSSLFPISTWFHVCGSNYPHQALKGGYFVFVWRVGT